MIDLSVDCVILSTRSPTHSDHVPVHDELEPEDQYLDTTLRQTRIDPHLKLGGSEQQNRGKWYLIHRPALFEKCVCVFFFLFVLFCFCLFVFLLVCLFVYLLVCKD